MGMGLIRWFTVNHSGGSDHDRMARNLAACDWGTNRVLADIGGNVADRLELALTAPRAAFEPSVSARSVSQASGAGSQILFTAVENLWPFLPGYSWESWRVSS